MERNGRNEFLRLVLSSKSVRNFGFADFLFPRVNVTVLTREE